jgi:hypothetical protein
MKFSLKSEVCYKDVYGFIDFIDTACIVIQLPAAPGRNPPRVVVYHCDFDKIKVLKDINK